jgi:hypothetical protein
MDTRRRLLLLRLGLYVVLGAVVALVLVSRPHDDGVSDLRRVVGSTETGQRLVLKLDDDGVLRSWDIWLHGRCFDGSLDALHWWPDDNGAPARFTRRGDVVDAVETGDDALANGTRVPVTVRLHARVTDRRATGTFRYGRGFAGRPLCWSGPIPFAVALDPAS